MTLTVARLWYDGGWMNWKGFGSERPWPNQGAVPAFVGRVWWKPRKLESAACVPALIRTEHLPNPSQERYLYPNPFGERVLENLRVVPLIKKLFSLHRAKFVTVNSPMDHIPSQVILVQISTSHLRLILILYSIYQDASRKLHWNLIVSFLLQNMKCVCICMHLFLSQQFESPETVERAKRAWPMNSFWHQCCCRCFELVIGLSVLMGTE
jgi:hypothetical protein